MKKTLLFLFMLLLFHLSANSMTDFNGITVSKVKVPFYQKGVLQSMIFADKAEYRAQLLYGYNVIINMLQKKVNPDRIRDDWQLKIYPLNASLAEIGRFWSKRFRYCDAVIHTPEGTLDQAEQNAASDREVKFRSPVLDLDGIGFAADFKRQQIKVNSNVRIIFRNQSCDPRIFDDKIPEKHEYMQATSDMLHIDSAKNRILLLGKVNIIDKDTRLTCDRLTLVLNKSSKKDNKSNMDFSGARMIYADGNVKVEKILPPGAPATASQELTGDHLVYDIPNNQLIVTGDNSFPEIRNGKGFTLRGKKLVFFRAKQQLIVPENCWMRIVEKGQKRFLISDYGNFNFSTGICDFLGNVRASSLQEELACAKMRVYLERTGKSAAPSPGRSSNSPLDGATGLDTGSLEFKRALCKGNVKLFRREKAGFSKLDSDEAELDYLTDKALFSGNVRGTSGGNALSCSRMIVNLKKTAGDSRSREVENIEVHEKVRITGTPDAKGTVSVLTSDRGFFDYKADRIEFTGSVQSTRGKSSLSSQKLEFFLGDRRKGEAAAAIPGVASGASKSGKTLKRVLATGDAIMKGEESALSGDRIEYFFVPAAPGKANQPGMFQSGSLRLVKVTSDGNVKLINQKEAEPRIPGQTVSADSSKSADAGVMLGRNAGFRKLTSQQMVSDFRKNITVFTGDVAMTDGASSMDCEKLELFSKVQKKPSEAKTTDSPDADPFDLPAEDSVPSTIALGNGMELDRAVATENVVIKRRPNGVEEGQTVYCDHAIFNSSSMTIECTSTDGRRPRAVGSGKTHTSDKFTIFLKDERLESSGDAVTQ